MISGEIEIMKTLYFDDFEDLACDIADTYDSLKGEEFDDVAIIAKYEEARQIVKELICIGYDISNIELHEVDWDNYDAEYIITLYDNSVWCEPMLRENGYIEDDAPVIYVLDNCSSKVIPYCKGKTVYEVTVGIDEDDCDCDDCSECACKKDEKPTTTSATSKSIYKINNKEVSKEEFDKEYEKFEEVYLDNIHDMILSYCEFMDKANEWRKWFLRW